MVNAFRVEIFARFKFAFDSTFVKIAKIKRSRKFHGLQYGLLGLFPIVLLYCY
jgi:hypothetical protein